VIADRAGAEIARSLSAYSAADAARIADTNFVKSKRC
jgi:hypothetical protein